MQGDGFYGPACITMQMLLTAAINIHMHTSTCSTIGESTNADALPVWRQLKTPPITTETCHHQDSWDKGHHPHHASLYAISV